MRKCDRCGKEVDIESHHIHCRFMNNKQGKGKIVDLCKDKCHIPLHLIISSILWKYIKKEDEEQVIKEVENFTYNYINNYHKKLDEKERQQYFAGINIDDGVKSCPSCNRTDVDIEDKICPYCEYSFGEDLYEQD